MDADPRRVWRAITDPDELCAWDENLLAPVDPPANYPCLESPQRWRYKLRGIQVLMHERHLEVTTGRRLRSALSLGGMKLEQTYTLRPESESRTRVSVGIVASNSIPVLGGTIDRFEVRQLVSERADSQLRALQQWCESRASAQPSAKTSSTSPSKSSGNVGASKPPLA